MTNVRDFTKFMDANEHIVIDEYDDANGLRLLLFTGYVSDIPKHYGDLLVDKITHRDGLVCLMIPTIISEVFI